jgi:transcriptional regulator with XRE-family HTH domain
MSDFGRELARLMDARGVGVRELARQVHYNPGHISNLRSGKARPSPELAQELDDYLAAGGTLAALAPIVGRVVPPQTALTDELAAVELARRAAASDVSDGTLERLEAAFDDLATAYPRTPSAELLSDVRAHLGYTSSLLDGRATLTQRRRLLVSGAWLSLLAATCLVDLHQDRPAVAYLRTAEQLARETEHAELAAWCAETRAWKVLTAGDYRAAVELSRIAQQIAPENTSVSIQATAQEGRAWARLGDSRETRASLAAVERLVSPLPRPERPEHHYVYDPQKASVYLATTLTWLGDTAAEPASRDILAALESPDSGPPRPRRVALARLDLGLALVNVGKHDEATASAMDAVRSGRLAPVDKPRVREIVAGVAASNPLGSDELTEAFRVAFPAQRKALP